VYAFVKEPFDIMVSLGKGMAITLRQMFARHCTIQYPDERLVWPDRTRGRMVLPRDPETGKHRCTACLTCQRNCPNGSIEIKTRTNAANKRELDDFLFHLDRCSFCGICVETCPFDALRMSHEHEIAVVDKAVLKRHLQDENYTLKPEWRGGLPAKSDK
jgi:NADH-quinone oxidoreductase subunit I